MENHEPVLKLCSITKSFGGIKVLNQIDLELFPGEVHCLVGENGAGKSTLIKIISGAYQPDSGTVIYQGEDVKNNNPHWAREHGINAIYQEIDLIPSLTGAENISLGSEPTRRDGSIDWRAVNSKAEKIIQEMGAEVDLDVTVGSLKVAYQQMIAIAKALSLNSKVLILDEPTAVFTSSEIEILFRIIENLKTQNIAIVYISHHMDEIFQIGDRVTVLRDGCLVRSGFVKEFDKNSLVKAMVGREIDLSKRSGSENNGEEMFRVEGLTRSSIVQNISFSLHRGEIIGIAGLVGAGRTETLRMLIGADTFEEGKVYLRQKEVKFKSPGHALTMGVGMLPESRKEEGLVLTRSMSENIAYGMVERQAKAEIIPWQRIKKTATEMIHSLNIRPANPNLQVTYMSGGNQQKVVLAKLLAAQCDVLLLDEPTRGVDVGARMEIYKLMQEMKAQGKAILMVSSDLPEILTQSDRILVMAKGTIAGELTGEEATEERILSIALQLQNEETHEPIR